MTARTALEVVSEAFAAGIAGDFAALLELLSDDVVLELPTGHPALDSGHSGIFVGRDEVEAALTMIGAKLRFTDVKLERLLADHDFAIGMLEFAGVDSDGNVMPIAMTECWWVESGKVTRIRPYYFDTKTLSERTS